MSTVLTSLGWTVWAACFLLASIELMGCATTTAVTPKLVGQEAPACKLHATIVYDGNPDYLPGALISDPDAAEKLIFRYTYRADYGLKQLPSAVQLVNPLNFVGFPTGTNTVVVTGNLDVMRRSSAIRSYAAAASVTRAGTMFSEGETFTAMRRRGLMLVRDNISGQLCQDRLALEKLLENTSPQPGQDGEH